jgi:hypothetical protein
MQSLQSVAPPQIDPPLLMPVSGAMQNIVPDYALLFFDHLYSEYLTIKHKITDEDTLHLLDSLQTKRENRKLTWSDIYTFDLALVDERPLENLIRKAYDARARYRSIAGQKEYDEYLASKPPDLTTILITPNNAPADQDAGNGVVQPPPDPQQPAEPLASPSMQIIQRILRADIRYLLSKFYLYYAMLPVREGLREELTRRAVRLTKWILAVIGVLIFLSVSGSVLLSLFNVHQEALKLLFAAFGPTIGCVVFAGIVGGCISMLQRIQSAPSEGDALFNLAALTNGWRGLSLSPLYGGIFALLLFILFAGGLLKGSAFPTIETAHSETPTQSTQANGQTATQDTNANTATQKNLPAAENTVLDIPKFLQETGPKDGVSLALLIIWSFIAGFAERLVPDTLNRLVAKNQAIQGTNG